MDTTTLDSMEINKIINVMFMTDFLSVSVQNKLLKVPPKIISSPCLTLHKSGPYTLGPPEQLCMVVYVGV